MNLINNINKFNKDIYDEIFAEYINNINNIFNKANNALYAIDDIDFNLNILLNTIKKNINVISNISEALDESLTSATNQSIHDDSYIYVNVKSIDGFEQLDGYVIEQYGLTSKYSDLHKTGIADLKIDIKNFDNEHLIINSNDFIEKTDLEILKGSIYIGSLFKTPYIFEPYNDPLYDKQYITDESLLTGLHIQQLKARNTEPLEVNISIKPQDSYIEFIKLEVFSYNINTYPEIVEVVATLQDGTTVNIDEDDIGEFRLVGNSNLVSAYIFIRQSNIEGIKISLRQSKTDVVTFRRGALYIKSSIYRVLNILESYIVDQDFNSSQIGDQSRFDPKSLDIDINKIIKGYDLNFINEDIEVYNINIKEIELYTGDNTGHGSFITKNIELQNDNENIVFETYLEGTNVENHTEVYFSLDDINWYRIRPKNFINETNFPVRYWFNTTYRSLNSDEILLRNVRNPKRFKLKLIINNDDDITIIDNVKVRIKTNG